MQIHLLGNRVLVKYVPSTHKRGRIFLPDVSEKHDTHRMGVVQVVGVDCKLVKVGDTVCFQVNDVMSWAQVFKRLGDGEPMLHLLESELIGRVTGDEITLETFEVLGDFVIVRPVVRRPESTLVIPDQAALTPDMLHYMLEQQGSTVGLPVVKGQEIIINHGRVSRMYMTKLREDGGSDNVELGYTLKEWVHGYVENDDARLEQG